MSGASLKGIDGVTFEILSEIKSEPSEFGMKPRGSVKVTKQGNTQTMKWNLNQQNLNYLIDTYGGNSNNWIGKTVGIFTEVIKGNVAIRIRGVV